MIIDHAGDKLNVKLIKQLYATLKGGTSDSRKTWFAVGGKETNSPEKVADDIGKLFEKRYCAVHHRRQHDDVLLRPS